MKRLVTVGKEYHKGYELMLFHSKDDVFNADIGFKERYRIIFVEEGSGILVIDGVRHIFVAPTVFCFNELDNYTLECKSGLIAETIWFHPTIINDILDFESVRSNECKLSPTQKQDKFWLNIFCQRKSGFFGQLNIGPGLAKRIMDIITSITNELDFQNDWFWPCRSRSFLIELLFLLIRISDSSKPFGNDLLNKDPGEIGKLLLYLNTNYLKKITIENLSNTFHINRTTLTKKFNEVTGMSVKAYLIRLRLHMASQMLKDTTLPVSEIINRVGFNDPVHFSRMFRRTFGYPPTEFRQKNCWMLS